MILRETLTVDTGLTTAWAYWSGTPNPQTGEFVCSLRLSQVERIKHMTRVFGTILQCTTPKKVILEMVELWEGSLKSKTAALRGDTFGLALLIGSYMSKCFDRNIEVELLTAREWKGSLTKEATEFRVRKINHVAYRSEHIVDAVGIGFSRDYDIWHLKKPVCL